MVSYLRSILFSLVVLSFIVPSISSAQTTGSTSVKKIPLPLSNVFNDKPVNVVKKTISDTVKNTVSGTSPVDDFPSKSTSYTTSKPNIRDTPPKPPRDGFDDNPSKSAKTAKNEASTARIDFIKSGPPIVFPASSKASAINNVPSEPKMTTGVKFEPVILKSSAVIPKPKIPNGSEVPTKPTTIPDVPAKPTVTTPSPKVLGDYASNDSCVDLSVNMYRGFESSVVTSLQNFLSVKGLLSEKPTGFYGDKTIEAVKAYQRSVNLPETGKVYDFTRQAIANETCK